ncbi:MAG: hypothetical protein IM524_09845 [Pseudanabaena sp. M051S1SP1A06QC]|jgi:hypothetical protein|nr:hypothetical protein [Pseudanabaena sp. M051S1SP1A06QC]
MTQESEVKTRLEKIHHSKASCKNRNYQTAILIGDHNGLECWAKAISR